MNTIIIYKGKYGATQQYAEWLGAEMQSRVIISHECSKEDINSYDYLIIGTSVYVGVLTIREWLKENLSSLKNKKIFLFVVCGTSPDDKEKLESYIQSSVPAEIRAQCSIYFLPGKLNYRKLSWSDKFMLRIGSIFTGNTNKQKSILADYDEVRKENIIPLVEDAKAFIKPLPLMATA